MKRIVFAFILFSSYGFAQTTTTPDSAKYHIGDMATVCGNVYAVHYSETGTSVIYFGDKKNNPFTAAIFAYDSHKFVNLEKQCMNKKVCVTGWVKDNRGKTQIIITEPSQLSIAGE
jgi:micrococcal nuclease